MKLQILDGTFSICQLPAGSTVPAVENGVFTLTVCNDEISIVCVSGAEPPYSKVEREWKGLRILGQVPFNQSGVLYSLLKPLAAAKVGIFAISTFNTDYLFVKSEDFSNAMSKLAQAGFAIS